MDGQGLEQRVSNGHSIHCSLTEHFRNGGSEGSGHGRRARSNRRLGSRGTGVVPAENLIRRCNHRLAEILDSPASQPLQ